MADTQISLRSVVAINKDVVSRDLEGEEVILNLESGIYFGLNGVGTRIWALIQEHRSLGRVFQVMQEEYEVAPAVLEADLLELVDALRQKGLVSVFPADERQHGQ